HDEAGALIGSPIDAIAQPTTSSYVRWQVNQNGRWWKNPVPQARVVARRWLVRSACELEGEHARRGRHHVRNRGRHLEVQRRARNLGAQAGVMGVAPQPVLVEAVDPVGQGGPVEGGAIERRERVIHRRSGKSLVYKLLSNSASTTASVPRMRSSLAFNLYVYTRNDIRNWANVSRPTSGRYIPSFRRNPCGTMSNYSGLCGLFPAIYLCEAISLAQLSLSQCQTRAAV
ncbi:hypothetical protein TPAR_06149, partial [Tolypocladium paradoxum]